MVKYAPLTKRDASRYAELAKEIISFSKDGKTAWSNFNTSTRGDMSREDKAAIFKYAYIYEKGKTNSRGDYIVHPGDESAAKAYVKKLIGKKIVHDLNGPKRAHKLIKSNVGGMVSGRSAEESYRRHAKEEMMRRMGDRYQANRKQTFSSPKKHKKSRKTKGEGYDGEGFSLFGNSSRPFEAARRRVAVRGSGLAGGFFDDYDSEDEVEYVGMGFDDEESYDSSEEYSD